MAGGTKNRTIPGTLRKLFCATVKAITRQEDDEPKPKPRRRGETEGDFRKLARAIGRFSAHRLFRKVAKKAMRRRGRTIMLPAEAYGDAHEQLSDTLTWLHQSQHDDTNQFDSGFDVSSEHLSPRL
jgi:hypothetical protein